MRSSIHMQEKTKTWNYYHNMLMAATQIKLFLILSIKKKLFILNNSKCIIRLKTWPSSIKYKFIRIIQPRRQLIFFINENNFIISTLYMSKSSKSKLKCPKCVNYSVGYYRTYQGITTYANKCYNIHDINFHNVHF